LLRQWRYPEARRLLWREVLRPLRPLARGRKGPAIPAAPAADPGRWLRPGNILLDADGAELFWLEQMVAAWVRPVVAYRSDIRLTARHGYHPVETVWLLEQAGYQVRLITASGPAARPDDWFAPAPAGAPGPWLLATPPEATP